MPKYRAEVSRVEFYTEAIFIEAQDENEARKKIKEGEYEEDPFMYKGDLNDLVIGEQIYSIKEMKKGE